MAPTNFSDNYLRFNDQQTKNLSLVVEIDGVDLLSNRTIYTKVRYGDAGIDYGDTGIIYGGLRKLEGVRQLLSLDGSSLTISQKNEPEQGRASVSTLTLSFVDKDQYMTQVCSRGVIVPEILGRAISVYLGYEEISWPEDYLKIFRGKITNVDSLPGLISFQFSDPNVNRRQNLQVNAKTKLIGNITNSATSITVEDNSLFPTPVLGPNGFYDVAGPWNPNGTYNPILTANRAGVRTFLKINDEWIEYGPLGIGVNSFSGLVRGARGSVAAAHNTATEISCAVEFQENALTLALKMMLSGWGSAWKKDVEAYSFIQTFDPILLNQPRAIILPDKVDAQDKYGLVEGDYVTIKGGVNDGITGKIFKFGDLFETPNRIIYIDQTLAAEYPTSATLEFRSKYDTYPKELSTKLTPLDVDVYTHEKIRGDFLSGTENQLRFFYQGQDALKSFLEREVYLPSNTYSLSKRGSLSVGFTKPPLADEQLIFLDKSNILNPDQIKPSRGLNNRKFFNEIDWDYDARDDGSFKSFFRAFDSNSVTLFDLVSILPIKSKGLRSDLSALSVIQKRARFLLSRYKNAATLFSVKVNWGAGCLIEAGDIVAVRDEGFLQISNFATGERNLGVQLFEVLERSLDIKSGNAQLTLVSDVGADIDDRFATISPSSKIVSGNNSFLIIEDSFGAIFPGDESRKWKDHIGQKIRIHDEDYTYIQETSLLAIDPVNTYKLSISGLAVLPMSFSGLIIDIVDYPDSTSKTEEQLYKLLYGFMSPTVQVLTGSSNTQFTVNLSDADKFFIGSKVRVHTEFYTVNSPEVKVIDIFSNTITVDKDLGFTPNNTYFITVIGFKDKQGSYRYI